MCTYFSKYVCSRWVYVTAWMIVTCLTLYGWVGDVVKRTLWVALSTFISYMHMRLGDMLTSYMQMDLQWFYGTKPMVYDILIFKRVTRNGIFDSNSDCLQSVGWFTYLNGIFKYVIIKAS